MTCREFKHSAASFNLWELSRTQNAQLLGHAEKCESCGGWLQKQRTLGASMQTLRARTASLEAGPDVERALLRAFRQVTPRGAEERAGSSRLAVTPLSTPMALRLSRFFEVGAYVAIAAAIIVGVFLGVRLLQHSSQAVPVQSQTAPPSTEPLLQKPAAPSSASAVTEPLAVKNTEPTTVARKAVERSHTSLAKATHPAALQATADDSRTDDTGYVALMFCDPLSCASETQVVRVELPGGENGSSASAQPQMADVVVGYDGVVRAVRMVN